ncbi:transporter [Micromonospora zhanjiangensis]|uniref:Transporter n=1 Tax=Micromonospora zhanjiangensis TaxID=1522057 RepID=A0ABV8KSL7_9ACTN
MNLDDDELPPTDPAETLRLIREQQAEAARRLTPDQRLYYWPWGIAWLIGFGLFFLRYGPDGRVFVDLPDWLPLAVLFALLIAAGIFSGVAGGKASGQVVGDSNRRGAWYGFAWFLGYTAVIAVNVRVSGHLTTDLAGLLWAASSVGLAGALQMAGGAIWLDRDLFVVGAWVTVLNIVGVVVGPGWHSLIVSVAGGGGMLLAGALTQVRRRTAAR